MSFNAKKLPTTGGKKRDVLQEAGAYPARLVGLVLMGKQKERAFKGEEAKPPRLHLRMTYELVDEFLKDEDGNDLKDKPRWITEEIAFLSLKQEKAKSTKVYYALDPDESQGGDFSKLIGKPCMLTIVLEKDKRPGNDNVYEKIASVSSLRPKEAEKLPPLVNDPLVFDFYDPDLEVWEKLPEWLQDKIKESVDFEGGALQKALKAAGKNSESKAADQEDQYDEDDSEGEDEENW